MSTGRKEKELFTFIICKQGFWMWYYVVGNNILIWRVTVYNPETWVFKISWLYRAGVHILSWGNSISIKKNAMLSQLDCTHATKGQGTSSPTFSQRNNSNISSTAVNFSMTRMTSACLGCNDVFSVCLLSYLKVVGGLAEAVVILLITKNEVLQILPSKAFTDLCSGLWVDLFSH